MNSQVRLLLGVQVYVITQCISMVPQLTLIVHFNQLYYVNSYMQYQAAHIIYLWIQLSQLQFTSSNLHMLPVRRSPLFYFMFKVST